MIHAAASPLSLSDKRSAIAELPQARLAIRATDPSRLEMLHGSVFRKIVLQSQGVSATVR
jgi:hypothetical protein